VTDLEPGPAAGPGPGVYLSHRRIQKMEVDAVDPELWAAYIAAEEEGIAKMCSQPHSCDDHADMKLQDSEQIENADDAVLQYLDRVDRELSQRQTQMELSSQPSNISADDSDEDFLLYELAMVEVEKMRASGALRTNPILVDDVDHEPAVMEVDHMHSGACRDLTILVDDAEIDSAVGPNHSSLMPSRQGRTHSKLSRADFQLSHDLMFALKLVRATSGSVSDEQDNVSSLVLINYIARPAARRCFLHNWLRSEGREWCDTPACGRSYLARERNGARWHSQIRAVLHAGDSAKWDITALRCILTRTSVHPLPPDALDRADVDLIAEWRNRLAHERPPDAAERAALRGRILAFAQRHGVYVPAVHDRAFG
jgi:hypothetical protein